MTPVSYWKLFTGIIHFKIAFASLQCIWKNSTVTYLLRNNVPLTQDKPQTVSKVERSSNEKLFIVRSVSYPK